MRTVLFCLAAAALLLPEGAAAQGRDDRRDDRDRREVRADRAFPAIPDRARARQRDRRDVDRRDVDRRAFDRRTRVRAGGDRFDRRFGSRYRGSHLGRGPAFCRSGKGHPVFGRRWCLERGFGLGGRGYGLGYGRGLPDIIFRRGAVYPHGRYGYGGFGAEDLVHLLGHAAVDRLLHDLLGLDGRRAQRVRGRWYDPRRHGYGRGIYWQTGPAYGVEADGLALQLFLDDGPLAEIVDLNRDGRVDMVLTGR